MSNKYKAIKTFASTIFKNMIVPKGAILENRFGVLYYLKRPVLYIEEARNNCVEL